MDLKKGEPWLHIQQILIDLLPDYVEVDLKNSVGKRLYKHGKYYITVGRKGRKPVVVIYAWATPGWVMVDSLLFGETAETPEAAASAAVSLYAIRPDVR